MKLPLPNQTTLVASQWSCKTSLRRAFKSWGNCNYLDHVQYFYLEFLSLSWIRGRSPCWKQKQWCDNTSFKASSQLQTATMCFSPGTSEVTRVTTNLPSSTDAIQIPHPETHTGFFVCFSWGLDSFFSPRYVEHAVARTHTHACRCTQGYSNSQNRHSLLNQHKRLAICSDCTCLTTHPHAYTHKPARCLRQM